MDADDLKTVMIVGALGVAAYLIYQAIQNIGKPISNAVSAATNAATSGIANAYVGITQGPGASVAAGSVIMPDGSSFPSSQLTSMGVASQGAGSVTFQSNGTSYQLAPADSNGNYSAVPLSGLGGFSYRRRTLKRER